MTGRLPIRLTLVAQQDVRGIARTIRNRHGAVASKAFRDRLTEAIARLGDFPLSGTIPRELDILGITEYREISSGMNRIIYSVMDGAVIILIVADARRDLQSLLERRLLIG